MAYTAGDTILDDEYNVFVTGNADGSANHAVANVNSIWGTGDGDQGYGQTGTLSAVSAGSSITATQWNNFLGRIETISAHQGSTVTDYSSLTTSDSIDALSTVATDLATIKANRLNAAALGSNVTAGGASSRSSAWAGQTGTQTVATTQTITFSSEAHMESFFNSGGLLNMTFARSGGTSNNKNTEWSNLCTDMGTVTLSGSDSHTVSSTSYTGTTQTGGAVGGTGSAKSTIDFHALTGSLQQLIIKYSDGAPYTANYIKVQASKSGAVLTLTTTMVDDAADTANPTHITVANPYLLDQVDGTLTVTAVAVLPSETYLTNTWGTPTLATSEAL